MFIYHCLIIRKAALRICFCNMFDDIFLFKQYFISKEKGLDNRLLAYIKSSPG